MQVLSIVIFLSACFASSEAAPVRRDESYSAMCAQRLDDLLESGGDARVRLIESFGAGVDEPVAALDLLKCTFEGCRDLCGSGDEICHQCLARECPRAASACDGWEWSEYENDTSGLWRRCLELLGCQSSCREVECAFLWR